MNFGVAFDSDSESDDERDQIPPIQLKQKRFDDFCDEEIRKRFRFTRRMMDNILALVEPTLRGQTKRAMHPETQLLAAFRYYATGDHLRVIGDTLNLHISSVSRAITTVTDALLRVAHYFIKIPTGDRRDEIKRGIFKRSGMPGIIGYVDGTHVKLQRPIGQLDSQYICRKGYPSLNILAMCDHKMRFCYVMSKYPGSAHDSFVMRASNLFDIGEAGNLGGIILGDSGYAQSLWLYTPILFPKNTAEEDYNRRHKYSRVQVEQAFGILKRRWICTHSEMRLAPGKVAQIFIVCCMLHNIAIDAGLPDDEEDDDNDSDEDEQDSDSDGDTEAETPSSARREARGKLARNNYIQRLI